MKRILFYMVFFTVMAQAAMAQGVIFSGSAPKVVSVEEQFRLTYTANKKAGRFVQPKMENFQVLMGPSTSYNQSTSIINGKMSRQVSYTYTFILQATKEGTFTIGPAKIQIGRKNYDSNPVDIEVVKGAPPATQKPNPGTSATIPGVANSDLFARVLVNKKTVYQGEHIIATIKIFTKVNLSGFEDVKFPPFGGFLKEEIKTPPLKSLERENVNGQIYGTGVLSRVVLFPQRSGNITIDPVHIQCLIQQRASRSSNSFFDDFFDSYKTIRKQIESPPVFIKVKPLPTNAPPGFTGTVGTFKMTASLDKTELNANDAVTLKIRISGNGNLKLLEPPDVSFPPDFETYDPKSGSSLKNDLNGSSGSKTFEYLMIPRFAGDFRIAPVKFSYFDPVTGTYKTLSSRQFNIHVNKGDSEESGTMVSSPSQEGVKFIGKDIRFINTEPIRLSRQGNSFLNQWWYLGAYPFALLIFLFIFLIHRKKAKEKANYALLKNRKAGKFARKWLKMAAAKMKNKEESAFYEAVLKALWGFLSDKLGIPLSLLSKDNVAASLKEYAIDENLIQLFLDRSEERRVGKECRSRWSPYH